MYASYSAQFCSELVIKFPMNIGGIWSVSEFPGFSMAGKNSPRVHTRDCIAGPCVDRKASVIKPKVLEARRAGGQTARWVRGPADAPHWDAPLEAAVWSSLLLPPTYPWAKQQLELLTCRALKYQQQGKHYCLASWEDRSPTSDSLLEYLIQLI